MLPMPTDHEHHYVTCNCFGQNGKLFLNIDSKLEEVVG